MPSKKNKRKLSEEGWISIEYIGGSWEINSSRGTHLKAGDRRTAAIVMSEINHIAGTPIPGVPQ